MGTGDAAKPKTSSRHGLREIPTKIFTSTVYVSRENPSICPMHFSSEAMHRRHCRILVGVSI